MKGGDPMRCLLINADYTPLKIISRNRAVILVVAGDADIVEAGEGFIRSPSLSIPTPDVIKLKHFVRVPYRARIPLTNAAVMHRDNRECAYCTKRKGNTVDHIVPRSRGGKHEWTNVVACCARCNHVKSDRLLKEIGWTLRFEPYMPTGTFWLILGMQTRESWEPYLAIA
jgi:5-methylcytosine-specific restriction endonuclease McrA